MLDCSLGPLNLSYDEFFKLNLCDRNLYEALPSYSFPMWEHCHLEGRSHNGLSRDNKRNTLRVGMLVLSTVQYLRVRWSSESSKHQNGRILLWSFERGSSGALQWPSVTFRVSFLCCRCKDHSQLSQTFDQWTSLINQKPHIFMNSK